MPSNFNHIQDPFPLPPHYLNLQLVPSHAIFRDLVESCHAPKGCQLLPFLLKVFPLTLPGPRLA